MARSQLRLKQISRPTAKNKLKGAKGGTTVQQSNQCNNSKRRISGNRRLRKIIDKPQNVRVL
jgi:hypothetical protein